MQPPDITVHDLGGSGPVVLYAHATGFHGRCWIPIATRLPDHHNLALDARGHGDSPAPADWDVDWEVYGHDALAVSERLSVHGPILGVGHSMGGAALLMAALAAPLAFRGLVLYEPIAMPPDLTAPTPAGNWLAIGARKRRSSFPSFDDAIANYASKPPMNTFTPDALDAYVHHGFQLGEDGHVHLKCRPELEARTFERSFSHNTWGKLGDLQIPVWVVSGRPEESQPSARAAAIVAEIRRSRLIQLDHLDHFGPMTHPAEIAALIEEASRAFT